MQDLGNFSLESRNALGSITVAQFTDTHHFPKGVNTFHAKRRTVDLEEEGYSTEKNVELISDILSKHENKIDVVIFTGDIIDGRPHVDHDKSSFLMTFQDLINPLNAVDIPWVFLPGNHDDDGSPWKREALLEIFNLPGCLTPGCTNFNFTFTLSKGESKKVRFWVFDSGGNHSNEKLRYETFEQSAVDGFEGLAANYNIDDEHKKGFAFFHIPLPEYGGLEPVNGTNGLFEAALAGGMVPWYLNNRVGIRLIKALGYDKLVGSSKLNSGIFSKFVESDRILATFCGHDHHSDAIFKRDGVYLGYGRCSGHTPPFNWEGAGGPLAFEQGARIIEIECNESEKLNAKTYVSTFTVDKEDEFELAH